METEIRREDTGVLPVSLISDHPTAYDVSTLAFKRLYADVVIDESQGTEDPIQWGHGMHMLAWDFAIRDIVQTPDGVSAKLDLFYKNWSRAMNEVITLTTWGAVRAAGAAQFGARLALLQFKSAKSAAQRRLPGRIRWPGGGLSAETNPRAVYRRTVPTMTREAEGNDAQSS
jgi:hypothetical protein